MTVDARMPLQGPEKPVETFPGGGSYQGSLDYMKRTSEACKPIKRHKAKLTQIRDNLFKVTEAGYI